MGWFSNKYKCVFFDLDRTLWDFEQNARETLTELFFKYKLDKKIEDVQHFIGAYSVHNHRLWAEYTAGNLSKDMLREMRFYLTLKQFSIDDRSMGEQMDSDYVSICPMKTVLFPHAIEVLEYLQHKKYKMYIITNGFSETQSIKLNNCNIAKYFDNVFSSEEVGYSKPDVRIFYHALSVAQVPVRKCIMVGDDWDADICGAKKAGIHQIYFNPSKKPHKNKATHEVALLSEIKKIL